jgi:nitronate monooxygenase
MEGAPPQLSSQPRFSPADLRLPLVQAPLAGGASTPALAAAAARAGALGFLAGGYLTPEVLARQIAEARGLAGPAAARAFGVNLFIPQPVAEPELLAAYRQELETDEAARHGITLPDPDLADTDHFTEKIELLLADPVPVVSFTFGLPDADTLARLRDQGSYTIGTVTSAAEALAALAAGVDAICVQGPEAGGHRGVFDPAEVPSSAPLEELFAEIRAAVADSGEGTGGGEGGGPPLIAAGGLATARDVARLRAAGAALTQHGTAFLRADEAGTPAMHRDALVDPAYTETVLSRAFSGRWVRTLRNGFTDRHPAAPAAYPAINQLTRPLRAAALQRGDAEGLGLYAGVNHAAAQAAPAADILAALAGE